MQYVMFAKHLQEYPLEQAAKVVKSIGFDGLDLTVRGGGYVEPAAAPSQLPEAVKVIGEAGLTVPMITTNIIEPTDPDTEPLLAAAKASGIGEIKLGYHTYKAFGEYSKLIEATRPKIAALADLAAKHGVRVNLHVHSNRFLTANPAVVWWLLQDLDPAAIGAYVDPGHMVIEGAKDVWRQGMDLLGPRTNLVAVKAMAWFHEETGRAGRWVDKMVPLHRGMVDWVEVFRILRHFGYDGVVSLHSEYQGGHSWYDMSVAEVIDQTREDLGFIKACCNKAHNE